mmetsp:Transcript_294/g.1030  ORF Transcript_294/g.1030 Transcript_294/m.1030 type:complete len:96 (-) Transcript_294:1612-1899(-)
MQLQNDFPSFVASAGRWLFEITSQLCSVTEWSTSLHIALLMCWEEGQWVPHPDRCPPHAPVRLCALVNHSQSDVSCCNSPVGGKIPIHSTMGDDR